jgi:hypothetical protein
MLGVIGALADAFLIITGIKFLDKAMGNHHEDGTY